MADPILETRARLHEGTKIECAITILRPVSEVFAFWNDFSNLPKFMKNLDSVEKISAIESKWRWNTVADRFIEWHSHTIAVLENKMISWQSVGASDIDHAGSIWFRPAPQDDATEVHIQVMLKTPGGKLVETVARTLGEYPKTILMADLHRLKALLEAGEIPTTEGQPHGKRGILH
ncbi:MAG TPA: SRPBCC family protein [Bdellovibrionales bacterium]|nr:SRPBCC family protein [Bdellovibrionales bacterium]